MCNAPVPSRQQPARDIKDAANIQKLDRVETTDNKFLKSTFDRVDGFGTHDKTDPKEIALIRKIDLYC